MKHSATLLLCLCLSGNADAQSTVFTEEFETAGVQSRSPLWVWDGSAPTYMAGCTGNWGGRKETPSGNDINNMSNVEHWLFHPLTYDALLRYKLSVDINVQDPDMGGPDTFDEPFAFGGIGWMDMNPDAVNMAFQGIYSSVGQCEATNEGTYYAYGGSPGAGWQFGVVLASISPPGTPSPMWVEFDHVVVKTNPGNSQFVGAILLGGAYNTTTHMMNDNLRQQGLIPLTEPYTALGWPQLGGGGGETTTSAIINATYTGGRVVDWVRLELRQYSNSSVLVASRQALVLQNGTVISAQGSPSVLFGVLPSSYWVAVRHRNHLGAMLFSQITVPYPGGGIWTYNFTGTSSSSYLGTNALKVTDGKGMLWEGDVNGDHTLRYTGTNNDRDPILSAIGGVVPTNTVAGYRREDVNLDGLVKYSGSGNDRDPILGNIGGIIPTNTRVEQVP